VGASSIRQASAATSSVVVQKASSTANSAVRARLASSAVAAIASSDDRMPSWASMIQLTRPAQMRAKPGTANRSTSGAQTNLKVGSSCTQAKKPITDKATPCSDRRTLKTVENR
jgi:hypothetical protein